MKFVIDNKITEADIDVVMNYNTIFGEDIDALELSSKIEEKFNCSNEQWNKICIALFAYKLGEMQGKRQERAKKKVGVING